MTAATQAMKFLIFHPTMNPEGEELALTGQNSLEMNFALEVVLRADFVLAADRSDLTLGIRPEPLILPPATALPLLGTALVPSPAATAAVPASELLIVAERRNFTEENSQNTNKLFIHSCFRSLRCISSHVKMNRAMRTGTTVAKLRRNKGDCEL
jgi:hypothetical protein